MTAHAMKGDREKCLAAGMDGYVSKPIKAQEVLDALEEVIRGTTSPGAAGAPIGSEALQAAIDLELLQKNAEGDMELVAELTDLLLADAPTLTGEIEQGLADGNQERVRVAAHTLKGMVANFGAERARLLAESIEHRAADGGADAGGDWPALKHEMERVVEALAAARALPSALRQ